MYNFCNDIPVLCPGLTDGSLEDMLHIHSFRDIGLVVDVVQDIRAINGEATHASPRKTGMIILGGGLPKHHICNENLMRDGADYAVFINTAQEFDGSDSGASPNEAVSWGKNTCFSSVNLASLATALEAMKRKRCQRYSRNQEKGTCAKTQDANSIEKMKRVRLSNAGMVGHLRGQEACKEDGYDVLGSSMEVKVLSKVKEVEFWVKKGFSAHVSTGSGSGGSIWRIQVLDMAY
ncbi:deoxyhypusine synthase isoform X2 [Tanacetum coccineum]